MNLETEIVKTHNKRNRDKIVAYIGNDPGKFAQLVEIFLMGPDCVTQVSSWPLSYCVEKYPSLLKPNWKKILAFASKPDMHDAVKRNTMRMIQFAQIPKIHQGITTNLGFKFLADTREPAAIRVFAMSVLANLANEIPELKNELIPLIEQQLPYSSAAFISRGRKVLKNLKK